jgi:hypothetical protein
MRTKKMKTFVAATLVCGLAMLSTGIAPAGAALPLHTAWSGSITCGTANHTVYETLPNMTSTNGALQKVWFLSIVQRWNGSSWAAYSYLPGSVPQMVSGPPASLGAEWFLGAANGSGMYAQWGQYNSWVWPNGNNLMFTFPHTNLPSGHYRVQDYFEWADGSLAQTLVSGGAYCTF